MPGMTVAEPRSMTRAPAGISTDDPTLVMRSPLMRMTWLLRMAPDLESNMRPARIATTWSDGARYLPAAGFRAAPPSCDCAGPTVAPIAAATETTARVLCQRMESSLMVISNPKQMRRHSGATQSGEPGIHNREPGVMDSGLAT